jgi:hypothetical protein
MMFLRFSKSQVQKLIVNRHIRPNVLCDIETIMNLGTTGSLSLLRIITSPLRFNSQSRNLSLTTRKEDLALNTDPFSNDIDTKVSSA